MADGGKPPRLTRDHERDILRPKTPPAGVRAQTAQPLIRRDDDTTPPAGTPLIDELAIRARRTQHETTRTLDVSQSTLERVGDVRREMGARIEAVDAKVERLDARIEVMSDRVGDLRESVGEIVGTLAGITTTLAEDREERRNHSMMRVTAFQADVEIDKTRQIAEVEVAKTGQLVEIQDKAAINEYRRKKFLQVLAIVSSIVALISTTIAAGNC